METIISAIVGVYLYLLFRGSVWIFHTIFVIGSVIVNVGLDIIKPKKNNEFRLFVRTVFVILFCSPIVGFLSIVSVKYFNLIREAMVERALKDLINNKVDVHMKNVFEKMIRANLNL